MSNSFSRTTSTSIFGRMKNAIVSVFIGILMIPGSVLLMGWNEYRSVRTIRSLNDGLKVVQPNIDISQQNADLDGTLIHFTETATTDEELNDDVFGVREVGIRLNRKIEMYQWQEKKDTDERKKVGGGTETTESFSYEKVWSSDIFDSSGYEQAAFRNPAPKFPCKKWVSENVTAGAYQLPRSIVSRITKAESIAANQQMVDALPEEVKTNCILTGTTVYYSPGTPNPQEPRIGDQRISFEIVRPQIISAVTSPRGDTFEKYKTRNGTMLELVQPGEVSAEKMFEIAKQENAMRTWILRLVGFVLAGLGISMVLGPLAVMMDVIPFLGSLARGGIFIVAFLGAVIISSFTIAISWIAVRPLVGIPLLLVGVAGIVGLVMFRKKSANAPSQPPFSNDSEVDVVG